jgi:hypothetical protein
MDKAYKDCQSCGMPLKKDERGGGTNVDGSKSKMYCSRCYEKGKFTLPNITAQQMQDLVRNKMKEIKFPGFLASFFVKRIPKLERWKTN